MGTKKSKAELRAENKEKREKEQEFFVEVIDVYWTLTSLWDSSLESYHDRTKRNEEYNLLLHKYQEMFPTADIGKLKTWINTMRTNYRAELKKELKMKTKTGSGADAVYASTKWYYRPLSFLHDVETPAMSSSTMIPPSSEPTLEEVPADEVIFIQ